ncbi:hypothetical protein HK100_003142 [Physocladia obscura]|uniref:Fe2OG dioxygenase domain-containing protein n=1 Tax=Physocladia obscura TaxID=109957 RepID=A0AAD5SVX9_9FUNG|nr:hypothetical protein HK100_003142 [Physocladia obscura]
MTEFETVDLPVINLHVLLTDSSDNSNNQDLIDIGKQILLALESVGAFQCFAGSGDSTLTDVQLFGAADGLFSLDESAKQATANAAFLRGYIGMGRESGGAAVEVKEGFSWGSHSNKQINNGNKLQYSNVFPSAFSSKHVSILEEAHSFSARVAQTILRALSYALLNENSAIAACCAAPNESEAISLSRLFRYYPYAQFPNNSQKNQRVVPHKDRIGSSHHTDWGLLTLIRSLEPGLQIASTSAVSETTVWRTVVPRKDCFIVNGGDYLSIITNGVVRSPLHRVVNSDSRVRTSFVFFYYPPFNTTVPRDFKFLQSDQLSEEAFDRLNSLSLFKDQRDVAFKGKANGTNIIVENGDVLFDLKKVSFGQYICSKWESVARFNY